MLIKLPLGSIDPKCFDAFRSKVLTCRMSINFIRTEIYSGYLGTLNK